MPELCDGCFKGARHEGVAEGNFETIAGVGCYVGVPPGDYVKDKVVLLLTDVFGLISINNQLLADDFARNGYKTIAPDILNNDPIPNLDMIHNPNFDRDAFMASHSPETWMSSVDKVVEALKADGVTRIATAGYCWGAPPSIYLACKRESHAVFLAHPSLLEIPGDIEKYKMQSGAPLLIHSCENDPTFSDKNAAIVDSILGEGKFTPGYERTHWRGVEHGFASRGDLNDPKTKAAKEGAFEAAVKFFNKYL